MVAAASPTFESLSHAPGPARLSGARERVEAALRASVAAFEASPPRLRSAIDYALFPGGARLRPLLAVAVAEACGGAAPEAASAAAAAVELFHCASLVHDDLPCFDDAELRRGKPTVHRAFGEATAVLVGDALIVHGFQSLARLGPAAVEVGAEAVGAVRGLIAGQAWESEPSPPLDEYHRAKTASLFQAAASLGALAAGKPGAPWARFGELVGRAYQAADDLSDALGTSELSGKTTGRDAALSRPSAVHSEGVEGALRRVLVACREAEAAVPEGASREVIERWLGVFRARVEALVPARSEPRLVGAAE